MRRARCGNYCIRLHCLDGVIARRGLVAWSLREESGGCGRGARASCDELAAEKETARRARVGSVDSFQQHAQGQFGLGFHRPCHHGDAGGEEVVVVESDERDVTGHRDVGVAHRVQGADGKQKAGREHRCWGAGSVTRRSIAL